MNLVFTIAGLIDYDALAVNDVVEVGDNYRKVATEYRYEGRLVKRSVAIEALRPLEAVAEAGQLG